MNLQEATAHLFRRALLLWVLLFTFFSWTGFEAANILSQSPQWLPPGPLKHITHALPQLPDTWQAILLLVLPWVIIVLAAVELWRPTRWWIAALIWWLYVNVMNTGWLSGSGGQQLMANVLFWSIFLPLHRNDGEPRVMAVASFWIIRLQLLLAYAATGLHKLTGAHWLDGTAMGIVATDQAFGPAWLASWPGLSGIITWSVLLFQLSFPIAVWFRKLRLPWMLFGVAFHLGTTIWMDIPEMGLAFVVCYVNWLDDHQVKRRPWLTHNATKS
ncbi:MAG TPA: hypothetical protein PKY96_02495 [Flavobacteriales bacterium]|nr:hypothetical protein [Flavobacteriales bacterium]